LRTEVVGDRPQVRARAGRDRPDRRPVVAAPDAQFPARTEERLDGPLSVARALFIVLPRACHLSRRASRRRFIHTYVLIMEARKREGKRTGATTRNPASSNDR